MPRKPLPEMLPVSGDHAVPRADYIRDYNNGWRSSLNGGSYPDYKSWAYEDGFLDAGVGRAKWHLRDCLDHDNCGEG